MQSPSESRELGLVLLGSSTFPNYPDGQLDNPSFQRSADAFRDAIAGEGAVLAGTRHILDLFGNTDPPHKIIKTISAFLNEKTGLTDVVFYYCGHGSSPTDAYLVLIAATEADTEDFTALPVKKMLSTLHTQFVGRRVFFVLDSCFSGEAAAEHQSDDVSSAISAQLGAELADSGVAFFTAAAKGRVAIAPKSIPLTMFTDGLLKTLGEGIPGKDRGLTFRELFNATRARIVRTWGDRAVKPELHVTYMPEGDIADVAFFTNKAWVAPETLKAKAKERETYEAALSGFDEPHLERRLASLEMLRKLHKKTKSNPLKAEIVAAFEARRDDADEYARVHSTAEAILDELFPPPPVIEAVPPAPEIPEPVEPAPQVLPDAEKKPFEIRIQPGVLLDSIAQGAKTQTERGSAALGAFTETIKTNAKTLTDTIASKPLLNGRGETMSPQQPAGTGGSQNKWVMAAIGIGVVVVFFILVASGMR